MCILTTEVGIIRCLVLCGFKSFVQLDKSQSMSAAVLNDSDAGCIGSCILTKFIAMKCGVIIKIHNQSDQNAT